MNLIHTTGCIYAKDCNSKCIAKITFHEKEHDIYSISSIWVDASLPKQKSINKLLSAAIHTISSQGGHVVLDCPDANEWFKEHKEYRSILDPYSQHQVYDIVYHYCSLDTFMGIIKNKCIWLCDVQKSNDGQECVLLPNVISKIATERQLNDQYSDLERTVLNYILFSLNSSNLQFNSIYTACFSKKRDDLNQWRGYAADGTGICLGFKAEVFEQLHAPSKDIFSFCPVEYEEAKLNETAQNEINNLMKHIESLKHLKRDLFDPVVQNLMHDYLHHIGAQAAKYKKSAFHEEEEVRLILNPHSNITQHTWDSAQQYISANVNSSSYLDTDNGPFALSPLKYRNSNGKLQSYFELSFEAIKNDIFFEIIIGPKCAVTPKDIYLYLAANDYFVNQGESIFKKSSLTISESSLSYQ